MKTILFTMAMLCLCSAQAQASDAIPLVIKETTIPLDAQSNRASLAEALGAIFTVEELAVDIPERLQYGYWPSETGGVATIALDFDPDGAFLRGILDADCKEDNPPARELEAWLNANAGPGEAVQDGRVWHFGGFVFELTVIEDAGEDSIYGIWITKE